MKISKAELAELKKVLQPKNINKLVDIDVNILKNLINRIDQNNKIKLFVDGAANLHTNTAGIGGVIYRNGEEIYTYSEYIGSATNNEAEYKALIRGLKELINLKLFSADIFADSELVVKQINGIYKVKNERMQSLHKEAHHSLKEFESWSVSHIPREKNSVADKLSKDGMRNKK